MGALYQLHGYILWSRAQASLDVRRRDSRWRVVPPNPAKAGGVFCCAVEWGHGAEPLRTTPSAIAIVIVAGASKQRGLNLDVGESRRILTGLARLDEPARTNRTQRSPVSAWLSRLHRNRHCRLSIGNRWAACPVASIRPCLEIGRGVFAGST
jgi:hypothetical protein